LRKVRDEPSEEFELFIVAPSIVESSQMWSRGRNYNQEPVLFDYMEFGDNDGLVGYMIFNFTKYYYLNNVILVNNEEEVPTTGGEFDNESHWLSSCYGFVAKMTLPK
jgi:hypothetical protein